MCMIFARNIPLTQSGEFCHAWLCVAVHRCQFWLADGAGCQPMLRRWIVLSQA